MTVVKAISTGWKGEDSHTNGTRSTAHVRGCSLSWKTYTRCRLTHGSRGSFRQIKEEKVKRRKNIVPFVRRLFHENEFTLVLSFPLSSSVISPDAKAEKNYSGIFFPLCSRAYTHTGKHTMRRG